MNPPPVEPTRLSKAATSITPQAMLADVRRFDAINQEMQELLARLAAALNQTMKTDGRAS
ncbi:MAG: hypothetical protein LT080_00285 [Thiobacillus sp.]|nr:hypothetical protein [Thiobacillus sp.]